MNATTTSGALGLATLLVLTAGCSAREKTWKTTWPSHVRFYEAAWGAKPEPDVTEQARARFDCIWDAMEKRGSDPEADLTCWAKRVDHVASCMRRLGKGTDAKTLTKGLAECHDSAAAVCPLSPLFEQQAKACQKAAAGTEGSTW